LAAVEEQRVAVVAFHTFGFAEKDGVIAGRVFSDDVACEFGARVVKQRNSTRGSAIKNAQAGMFFRGLFDFREIFGDRLLASTKNADTEAAPQFREGKKPGVVIHADENKKRIQRNGGEGIGGHAMHQSGGALNRNYSDARGKGARHSAKRYGIERRNGHGSYF